MAFGIGRVLQNQSTSTLPGSAAGHQRVAVFDLVGKQDTAFGFLGREHVAIFKVKVTRDVEVDAAERGKDLANDGVLADVLAKQNLDFIWPSKPSARSRNCFFVSLVVRFFADFVAIGRFTVKKSMFIGVSYSVIFSALVFAQGLTTEAAKTLFAQYVALEYAYDANIAELYADDALIKNKRIYPAGDVREITMPAVNYKTLLRQAMPIAKVRGDRSTYSQVTYTLEGERVRIQASRFSELKSYTSPISLLVGPSKSGKWLIYEELSESRP